MYNVAGTTFSGVTTPLQNHAITNSSHSQHPLSSSSPTTPVHTPASTPISAASTAMSNGGTNAVAGAQQQLNTMVGSGLLPPPLQNVETFGSFLGEEIVSSWRRGLELPPPPAVASFIEPTQYLLGGGCTETQHLLRHPNKKQHLHHHIQQQGNHVTPHPAPSWNQISCSSKSNTTIHLLLKVFYLLGHTKNQLKHPVWLMICWNRIYSIIIYWRIAFSSLQMTITTIISTINRTIGIWMIKVAAITMHRPQRAHQFYKTPVSMIIIMAA